MIDKRRDDRISDDRAGGDAATPPQPKCAPIDPSEVAMVASGDELYGIGTVIKIYARYMPEALFLCMKEGPLTDELRAAGRRVEVAGTDFAFLPSGSLKTLALVPSALRQARREASRLWPLLQRQHIKVFHSQWLGQYLIGGYLRQHGIKNIWHIQNNTSRTRLFGLGVMLNHLLARRFADLIIAASGFIAGNWEGAGPPVLRIWNSAIPIYDRVGEPPAGPIRCVVAGRLEHSKGHHLAVEGVIAARQAGFDIHLDIFGGPTDQNAYADGLRKRIVETENEQAITLHGFVTDLRRRHQTYHLGFQCRIDPEPCSLWVCEAHADGLPLLASASGGTPELVIEGVTGCLYEAGNQAQFTEKLRALLTEPGRLRAMRTAAFERGNTALHPSRMIRETRAAYNLAFAR